MEQSYSKEEHPKTLTEFSNDEFVLWMYRELLHRDPDETGFNNYRRALSNGVSRLDVFYEVMSSDEAQNQKWKQKTEFVKAGHFFSAIPNSTDIDRATVKPGPLRRIDGIDMCNELQLQYLEKLKLFYSKLPIDDFGTGKKRYQFPNGSYAIADAAVLMSMIGLLRPRRLIEIGCGNSSLAVRDANDLFANSEIEVTSVEPYPEFFYSLLEPEDISRTLLIEKKLQDLDLSIFDSLEPNDILFVDTTHVSKAGSDVNRIFFEILPRLCSGVYIHIHDVFYPFEYPAEWLNEGRCWNEQYLLQAFLQYNSEFSVALWPQYLAHRFPEELNCSLPVVAQGGGGGCVWLEKR